MKKITFAALGAVMVLGAGSAQAQQVNAVRWPVPMAFGSNFVAVGDAMPWVAQQIDKSSGGRIKLQIFEPGKHVPVLAVFDFVSEGKVEAGDTWMGYEVGKVGGGIILAVYPPVFPSKYSPPSSLYPGPYPQVM